MAISIEEALKLIYKNIKTKSTKIIPIEESLGYILAQDIVATYNLPSYDNSAMDGYAVKLEDAGKCLDIKTTIFAGDDQCHELNHNEIIKIMTGAKIPLGTQTIVPIEDTSKCDKGIKLPTNLTISKHIRLAGEDIKKGTPLLYKGDKISAHQITILASQGITHVKVHKKPRVALFASGNELKMHFENVASHQLYNTNSPTILARAKELGCEVEFIGTAHDSLDDIKEHIKSALDCDIIITSGGISVGDADFTKEAFSFYDYKILFDKIDIKPGKPTTFAKIGDKAILNLPGNPLASSLNFEIFARAIMYAMSGAKDRFIAPISTTLKNDINIKGDRRVVIPGYFNGTDFQSCQKFAPGMISPLNEANSFIIIDKNFKDGDKVKVISTKFELLSTKAQDIVS